MLWLEKARSCAAEAQRPYAPPRYERMMRFSIAGLSLMCAMVASAAWPRAAAAAGGCSSDTFSVKGSALTVELCGPPATARRGGESAVAIVETLSARGRPSLTRRVALDTALGDETSRTIDDAPLQALGITGTLHMTIAYRSGTVRLEHALLVPGAIALK